MTTSVVDYLKSISKDSSFETRAALAKQYGINNYTGDADQNTLLLAKLKEKEPEKVLKTGFITNNVIKAVKNLVTTGKTGLTSNDLYDYKIETPKVETTKTPFLSESSAYKAPASSLLSLSSALKTGGKIDTTSKYIQDPNNKNASIPNPYYKAESKTSEQVASDILKEDSTTKDAGTIYQDENGDIKTKEVEDSNLVIEDKPAQRDRILTLPAEQMSFDKWAQSNNIQDPFRDEVTDWEKLYIANKTLADAGTLSITQDLKDKYKLISVSSVAAGGATTTPITSIKYIDGFPKSSEEMEQWVAQGRVWDPVAGKWKEKAIAVTQEDTNSLLKSALDEINKRLAAGATLTTDQQSIYDKASAALGLYKATPTSTTTETTEVIEEAEPESTVEELENLNQLTDTELSGYTKQELRDAGLNILGSFSTFKAYAEDVAAKLKANPSVELNSIQRAVYNYYY